jgi:hypothetical protein
MSPHSCCRAFLPLVSLAALAGCDLGSSVGPPEQIVKIQFHYGFGNEIDTFRGTLKKNLFLDGSVTVPCYLSLAAQESVLTILSRTGFDELPDTIDALAGIRVEPSPGVEWLSVLEGGKTKTVVWFFPPGSHQEAIYQLSRERQALVEATPEYQHLPLPRGGLM